MAYVTEDNLGSRTLFHNPFQTRSLYNHYSVDYHDHTVDGAVFLNVHTDDHVDVDDDLCYDYGLDFYFDLDAYVFDQLLYFHDDTGHYLDHRSVTSTSGVVTETDHALVRANHFPYPHHFGVVVPYFYHVNDDEMNYGDFHDCKRLQREHQATMVFLVLEAAVEVMIVEVAATVEELLIHSLILIKLPLVMVAVQVFLLLHTYSVRE